MADRAVRGLEGSGRCKGGNITNKLKHAQQVMDFMGHNYQGIAHEIAPVTRPIFQAGTQRAVDYINPTSFFGNGMKKAYRRRKTGGFLGPAGGGY